MVGPAYPSVRMLLTAEANHNTCLEEITAGSTRVLKGLCFIKTEVSVQAVTCTHTSTSTHTYGLRASVAEGNGLCAYVWCVYVPLLFE